MRVAGVVVVSLFAVFAASAAGSVLQEPIPRSEAVGAIAGIGRPSAQISTCADPAACGLGLVFRIIDCVVNLGC